MCINSKAEADANPGTPGDKPDNMRPDHAVYMDGGPSDPGKGYGGKEHEREMGMTGKYPGPDYKQSMQGRDPNAYAEGGPVTPTDDSDADEMPADEELRAGAKSVYDMLRHKARYAKGGQVEHDRPDDLDDSDVEHGNVEDDLSFEALGKMLYDTAQLSKQPSNSNETGDTEERARDDYQGKGILGKIAKRGMKKIGNGSGMHGE
jgi:hypothetical protein